MPPLLATGYVNPLALVFGERANHLRLTDHFCKFVAAFSKISPPALWPAKRDRGAWEVHFLTWLYALTTRAMTEGYLQGRAVCLFALEQIVTSAELLPFPLDLSLLALAAYVAHHPDEAIPAPSDLARVQY